MVEAGTTGFGSTETTGCNLVFAGGCSAGLVVRGVGLDRAVRVPIFSDFELRREGGECWR